MYTKRKRRSFLSGGSKGVSLVPSHPLPQSKKFLNLVQFSENFAKWYVGGPVHGRNPGSASVSDASSGNSLLTNGMLRSISRSFSISVKGSLPFTDPVGNRDTLSSRFNFFHFMQFSTNILRIDRFSSHIQRLAPLSGKP